MSQIPGVVWRARCFTIVGLLAGCAHIASAEDGFNSTVREQLHAVLWMQRAAEYRASVAQVYRLATERLPQLKASGTALLEQQALPAAQIEALPPAIIMDIDETVLDNSYYQAQQLLDRKPFDDSSWQRWVMASSATALPGVVPFARAAATLGIRIFYVTNRECPIPATSAICAVKAATQKNFAALGFPGADDSDNFLLRSERPDWTASNKSVRRQYVGARYRVIALFGDDLRDFVERDRFDANREQLEQLFGVRWFMLPNAMYGSWERALAGGCAGSSAADCARLQLDRKYAALLTEPPSIELAAASNNSPRWRAAAGKARVRMATWNIEYLVEPATYAALRSSCVADNSKVTGAERLLPCDIVPQLDRTAADFAALRRYAAQLDADVVALEEVDGVAAAQQVFPGYEFCFTSRPNVQKNGFAIRRGLPFRCENEYLPLALDDMQRRGVVLTLFPNSPNEMTLLGVHLRSGCPVGPLTDRANPKCVILTQQIPALRAWIAQQAAAGRRFALLGDFNRRMTLEAGPARDAAGNAANLWGVLDAADKSAADLTNIVAAQPFTKCVAGSEYSSFIDTVVVGRDLASAIADKSFVRVTYSAADAAQYRLSDHCPVGIEFRLH